MASPTESDIMKMKKDDLKEVIINNGFGKYYKSSLLKAELQVLALKAVGLASDNETPLRTPSKTPRTARKMAAAEATPKAEPKQDTEELTSTVRRSIRQAELKSEKVKKFALTPSPKAISNGDHADKGNGGEEDAPDEFGDGADNGGMDSKLWSMVDGAFILLLFVIVVSVVIGYGVSDPEIKVKVIAGYQTLKGKALNMLAEAKGRL